MFIHTHIYIEGRYKCVYIYGYNCTCTLQTENTFIAYTYRNYRFEEGSTFGSATNLDPRQVLDCLVFMFQTLLGGIVIGSTINHLYTYSIPLYIYK